MLEVMFPFKLYLHIMQLEEYKPGRFISWVSKNLLIRNDKNKKPLVWTSKAKMLLCLSVVYTLATLVLLYSFFGILGAFLALVLATQPYVVLLLCLFSIRPYETFNKARVKAQTKNKILNLKVRKLKVIAISGSYGKTTTKEFLYSFLRTKFSVLKTPESYNTLFGISKVVAYELTGEYDFFICEMGAYKVGEIKELCLTVPPDHVMLTGINEQHIDRFKRIENTIKAKFEMLDYSDPAGFAVINGNSKLVRDNYSSHKKDAVLYGLVESGFYIKDIVNSIHGSEFTLVLDGREVKVKTVMLGPGNLENILGAATMAYKLGISAKDIADSIYNLNPVPNRQEVKIWPGGLLVIDDSFSSNPTGFKSALATLDSLKGYYKILATPGIVELGDATERIHEEIGKLASDICDKIFLIGRNIRTESLSKGVTDTSKVSFINSLSELPQHLIPEQKDNSVVLIENDLPDNY